MKPRVLKNHYFRDSKLSERVFLKILRAFADDLSASDAARHSGVSVRSVNDIYVRLRDRIWEEIWIDYNLFNGMGGYLRACAATHVRRDGKKLEYEGNPFKIAAGNGPYSSAALTDALEVKEELFNEVVSGLWEKRKNARRIGQTDAIWEHVIEIYARERSGTLRRRRDHAYVDNFAEAFLQAKRREDKTECQRLLDEYDRYMKRFEYRGANNKRFFDDLKRMLKRNPL